MSKSMTRSSEVGSKQSETIRASDVPSMVSPVSCDNTSQHQKGRAATSQINTDRPV